MIDQDTTISRQLTLWDQRGSRVIRGNLLVIPIDEALLYVEPVYLRAVENDLPQLKRIIVSDGETLAMEPSLKEALRVVFGGGPREPTEPATAAALPGIDLGQARQPRRGRTRARPWRLAGLRPCDAGPSPAADAGRRRFTLNSDRHRLWSPESPLDEDVGISSLGYEAIGEMMASAAGKEGDFRTASGGLPMQAIAISTTPAVWTARTGKQGLPDPVQASGQPASRTDHHQGSASPAGGAGGRQIR